MSGVVAVGLVMVGLDRAQLSSSVYGILFVMMGLGLAVGGRYIAAARQATAELAGGKEYRQLVEDHRRLTDMAITAHEHADLKLAEISVRIDHLTEQMASLRKILEEVE